MSSSSQEQQNSEHLLSEVALVLLFTDIDRTALPIVGGKAANLGEMTRSGLPVPPGFCVTTAAYALVAASAAIKPILAELATTAASDTARLAELASVVRAKLLAAPMPTGIADAIIKAYRTLGDGNAIPVAVVPPPLPKICLSLALQVSRTPISISLVVRHYSMQCVAAGPPSGLIVQ